jgi:hypothetical protein
MRSSSVISDIKLNKHEQYVCYLKFFSEKSLDRYHKAAYKELEVHLVPCEVIVVPPYLRNEDTKKTAKNW